MDPDPAPTPRGGGTRPCRAPLAAPGRGTPWVGAGDSHAGSPPQRPAGRESLLTEKGSEPCLAHAPGGRRGPVPRALVSGWCAVLAVVPLRSPSPGAVCRTPACHECEPLAVRTPAGGFEWRAIPLAGWLSGFEPSHIGCRSVPRGGWVGGKPSLPGAACSALGGSGGAPRVVLLGRGSSFPLPPRKARDTLSKIRQPRTPSARSDTRPPPPPPNINRSEYILAG